MATDERPRGVRRGVWLFAMTCAALLALVFGLLRAQGANGPATPVLSEIRIPGDPTDERSATFMFTDSETVTFECSLDGSPVSTCGYGVFGSRSYPGPLSLGPHRFEVRAATGSQVSSAASHEWTVVASPPAGGGGDGGTGDADSGTSSGGGAQSGGVAEFDISGSVGGLGPGITKTIVLTLANPNADPIYVTEVRVGISVDSSPPGCETGPNIVLEQPTGITSASPVLVPANDSVMLQAYPQAPRITFRNRSWNQDVCKRKSFSLAYNGSAHS